jgi:glycosyltransferase involved in cell wall biosynthesis
MSPAQAATCADAWTTTQRYNGAVNAVPTSVMSATNTLDVASKNIVLLSGFRIFPCSTGGHLRTAGIAQALARMGHRVLIYSLTGRQSDYGARRFLQSSYRLDAIGPNLMEETNLKLGLGLVQAVGRRLDYPRVWQHALLARGWVPARLKAALTPADIVLCDMPWCPPVPGIWSAKPWFLISHNLEHRLLEQGPARQHRFAAWMRGVEAAAPERYRDIFVCADDDRDFFRRHDPSGRLKLPFIGCGVDPNAYRVPAGTRERVRAELGLSDADHLLVFSASRFAPNVEALATLRDFCRDEADFLARERVHILVLGSVSEAPHREGALIATGRVPAVAPYFAASDAGLNPITRGSGANVKLFEYLAARLPVISTVFGVRGTQLKPEVDFLPYEPGQLRAAIERYVHARTRQQWKMHAEAVWARHYSSCDIDQLVKQAVLQRPEFLPA